MTISECIAHAKTRHKKDFEPVSSYALVGENNLPRFILYVTFFGAMKININTYIYNKSLNMFVAQIRNDSDKAYKEHKIINKTDKWIFYKDCDIYDNFFRSKTSKNMYTTLDSLIANMPNFEEIGPMIEV